ncbi:MAG: hypothetical protein ABIP75_11735 [Pyrinomonadaceae bacterium]
MTTHIQQRSFALSRVPQPDYVTATPFAAGPPIGHVKLVATDKDLADYRPDLAGDRGYATGVDFPTAQWLLSHDASGRKSIDVCSQEIGRLLLLAFGDVTTDQPDAGEAPSVYRHIFRPLDANVSRQLPATSLLERAGAAHDVMFPSAVVEKLTLHGDGKARLQAEFNWRSSGKRISPSGINWSTQVDGLASALNYFYNSQMTLEVDDGEEVMSYQCRYDAFTFELDNQLLEADGYRPGCALYQDADDPGSGMVRGECLFGERTLSCEFVVRLAAGGAEFAALQQQKSMSIVLSAAGGVIQGEFAHRLTVRLPVTKYQVVSLGETNGLLNLRISAAPLFDSATGKIAEVELINNVASYES